MNYYEIHAVDKKATQKTDAYLKFVRKYHQNANKEDISKINHTLFYQVNKRIPINAKLYADYQSKKNSEGANIKGI